jgi:hypothetical protein
VGAEKKSRITRGKRKAVLIHIIGPPYVVVISSYH